MSSIDDLIASIPDVRYHSPDCDDRVTSHTWESSGWACGTANEISDAPEYLREQWKHDRVAELAVKLGPLTESMKDFIDAWNRLGRLWLEQQRRHAQPGANVHKRSAPIPDAWPGWGRLSR
jgi:hypothetical protein